MSSFSIVKILPSKMFIDLNLNHNHIHAHTYIYLRLDDPNQGRPKDSLFNSYFTEVYGAGANPSTRSLQLP